MTSRPFDVELNLRQHGAALRQLAAELLDDGAAADDAVQETWLRTLRSPPRHEATHGGWLVTVLRNVARRLRRGERRRVLREAVVARADVVEDHVAVLAREELLHRLVAAVSSLDAPFREAIWQRYFEGVAPRDIAEASGVPLATVKSRLQRGLQQLRERLGEDGESGWRSALAVAFGWQDSAVPAGAAGTTATTWSGVMLMTAWTKAMTAVAVVAIAGVLFWSLPEPDVALPSASVVANGAGGAAAGAVTTAAKEDEVVPVAGVESSEVTRVVAAPPSRNATFRGRCVDEHGAPLAECDVVLRGWAGDPQRKAEWLADHAAEWKHQIAKSAADGTFAFEFLPPPPFQFVLDLMRSDRIPMSGGWSTIGEGERIDVGDVVFADAARVVGRVVDEAGKPVTKAQVTLGPTAGLDQPQGKARQMVPSPQLQTRTNESGAFAFRSGIPFGSFRVLVQDRRVAEPQQLELVRERPQENLTIVVVGTTDLPTITGRVVDKAGMPVGAWVHAAVAHGEHPMSARTGADGRFEVRRPDGEPSEAATISVVAEGFDNPAPSKPVPWGTRDLEFRVVRARGLSLRVVDAADAPIPDYRVHLLPQGGVGWPSGEAFQERARGPFENGTATIPGIKSGKWLVIVDFPPETPFLKKLETIDLVEGGPTLFTVRAESGSRRMLRVVGSDGEPIRGTRVQLCNLAGRTFGAQTRVYGERMWLLNQWNPNVVLAQFEATTDADGRVLLIGEGRRDLGLRILGPGNVLLERPGIRLDIEGELLVTVMRGARLVGKITPPEAMAELRRLAQLEPHESFAAALRPIVQLSGADNTHVPALLQLIEDGARKMFEIADDGSFDVVGLPSGAWQVQVSYRVVRGKGSGTEVYTVTDLTLAEGQTQRLDFDLQGLLPGTLEGEVTRNSQFLPNARITLERVADDR
ncbi:MAG: sigma-70 family RNA polymerase sigma factor, partial [Planctomycetota bacterium]|nr:sigma-70 family RNA polymerase sigma factor [Planctomycetota bacterium]